jgi:hypothetical protein
MQLDVGALPEDGRGETDRPMGRNRGAALHGQCRDGLRIVALEGEWHGHDLEPR